MKVFEPTGPISPAAINPPSGRPGKRSQAGKSDHRPDTVSQQCAELHAEGAAES
jgi:hypothetical protein